MIKQNFLKRIQELYEIGEIQQINKLSGGRINEVYEIDTKKGNFILKILNPKKINLKKLEKEFELMNCLKKRGFPYKVNFPLENINGNQLFSIKEKRAYIYEKIEGKIIDKYCIEIKHIKEFAKVIAIYHKFVKNIKINIKKQDIQKIMKEYQKLKIMRKSPLQKELMKDYEFFYKLLKESITHYLDKNRLIIHGDFSPKNIIFNKNKVVGIIDFEVIEFAPRLSDLQYLAKDVSYKKNKFEKKRYNLFIKEYNKWNKLTKEECNTLPFLMLLDECMAYLWVIKNLKNKKDVEYCKNLKKRTKTMIQTFHNKFKNSKIIDLV